VSVTTATLILLGLLVTLLVVRRKNQSPTDPTDKKPARATKSGEYYSVSIKLCGDACDAAREMAGERFLSVDAPQLPLPGCTRAECNCGFVHHADRRTPADRRSLFNTGVSMDSGTFRKEQRESRDDRRDDSRDDDIF